MARYGDAAGAFVYMMMVCFDAENLLKLNLEDLEKASNNPNGTQKTPDFLLQVF